MPFSVTHNNYLQLYMSHKASCQCIPNHRLSPQCVVIERNRCAHTAQIYSNEQPKDICIDLLVLLCLFRLRYK